MRITLGPSVVRGNIDETITGLWTFANVLGLLTNVIGERSAAAGVTVDGLLIKDAGIPEAAVTAHEAALAILESQITDGSILARLAANESVVGNWTFDERIKGGDGIEFDTLPLASTFGYLSRVLSDTFARFIVQADGAMAWGDGSGARDVNLFRLSANVLKTDDALHVGGLFGPLAAINYSTRNISLSAQANNLDTGSTVVQRITAAAPLTITGFAGGATGRMLHIVTIGANRLRITHESSASLAANRVITPNQLNMDLEEGDSAILVYDSITLRWRVSASTKIV